ncbi:hypothetical protein [Kitasatospora sp. NPDC048407]|uniref:hypothetical protein n=1 Tax=Kitasatospora sp. NPDC048407 TaxID=3364051 RepID=UPI003713B80E
MAQLDSMTIQRIARLVVDVDGPFERPGYQLAELLKRAAWPVPVEYDGTARVSWLTETITESASDEAAVSRFLCRICDPLEYEDGMASADLLRQGLNQILAAEQLSITYLGGRPMVGALGQDGRSTTFSPPEDLNTRVRRLVSSEEITRQLMQRVNETRICADNGAYVFALIGIGSFTEGLLLDVLTKRDPSLAQGFPNPNGGRPVPMAKASLALLLDTARSRGWIQVDAHDFMKIVREYRNFVHLRQQRERGIDPDHDTVMMCWGPVLAVLNDLESSRLD